MGFELVWVLAWELAREFGWELAWELAREFGWGFSSLPVVLLAVLSAGLGVSVFWFKSVGPVKSAGSCLLSFMCFLQKKIVAGINLARNIRQNKGVLTTATQKRLTVIQVKI